MAALFAPLEVVPGFCCFGESLSCVGQDNSGGGPTSLEVARPLRPLPFVCCSSHIDCHPPLEPPVSTTKRKRNNIHETKHQPKRTAPHTEIHGAPTPITSARARIWAPWPSTQLVWVRRSTLPLHRVSTLLRRLHLAQAPALAQSLPPSQPPTSTARQRRRRSCAACSARHLFPRCC